MAKPYSYWTPPPPKFLKRCQALIDSPLTDSFEKAFLKDVSGFMHLSPKQLGWLQNLEDRVLRKRQGPPRSAQRRRRLHQIYAGEARRP